jgi:hypothetical protein
MLIALRGDEYLPVLDEWTHDADFAAFVCILGEILARGDHAIEAPPRLLERLAAWEGLSRPQRLALETMVDQVIRRELPFEAVTDSLVITGPAGPRPDPAGSIRWHRRSWTWLRRNGRLDPTMLGGEYLDDAQWYEWLGRAWGIRLRSGSLIGDDELSLKCRLLGGGSAERVIRHEATHGMLVLSIVDSDSDFPRGKLGETATNALNAVRTLPVDAAPAHVEPLFARDVENVLPLALLEATHGRSNWLASMARRGFFARPELDPELAFVDVGKEQCERRLLNVDDPTTLAYREAALAKIRAFDPTCASAANCERTADQPECTGKATLPTSCVIVHNVGKPLRKILTVLSAEQKSPSHSKAAGSVAAWLATMLPADDPSVLTPARLAWSWGLRVPPRLLSAP